MHGIVSVPWNYDAKEVARGWRSMLPASRLQFRSFLGLAARSPAGASLDSAAIAIYAGALLGTLSLSAAYATTCGR